jgi:hypothetical protein
MGRKFWPGFDALGCGLARHTSAIEAMRRRERIEITHLRDLDLDGLRARWRSLTGRAAPPHVPKTLLLTDLSWR